MNVLFAYNTRETVRLLGHLASLPVQNNTWIDISIGFIETLPKLERKKVLSIFVDKLTRHG